MHRKWINEKDFVTLCFVTLLLCASLRCGCQTKNLSWFSALQYIAKL